MSSRNQFALLRERRFAPLFWVQFLGAANDNIFKFAFTLLATYAAAKWGDVDPHFAGFLIGALFIAPFMLFSATSGQLADKLEKSWFIRRVKDAEIVVMIIGAAGLALQSAPFGLCRDLPARAAVDGVRTGQVLLSAAAPRRARGDGRQRHG